METTTATQPSTPGSPRRRRHVARAAALLAVLALVTATACKPSDIIDPIVDPIEDLFGLGDDEIATPQFEVWNGITIQVVVRIDDLTSGLPVTVHVRCEGGTHLSQTVTVRPSGSVGIGDTTFTEGWPAGTDCIVSQDIVRTVETVEAVIDWVDDDEVRATFDNG